MKICRITVPLLQPVDSRSLLPVNFFFEEQFFFLSFQRAEVDVIRRFGSIFPDVINLAIKLFYILCQGSIFICGPYRNRFGQIGQFILQRGKVAARSPVFRDEFLIVVLQKPMVIKTESLFPERSSNNPRRISVNDYRSMIRAKKSRVVAGGWGNPKSISGWL